MSQNAWALRLGVSKAYLSQMVNGRRLHPGREVRRRMLDLLDLEIEQLFEVEDERKRPAPRRNARTKQRHVGSDASRSRVEGGIPSPRGGRRLLQVNWRRYQLELRRGTSAEMASSGQPSGRQDSTMERLIQDVKFALNSLTRRPAFVGVVLVTLALGIGANASIFSIIDGLLLRPLPYPRSDRLVAVDEQNLPRGWTHFGVSSQNWLDWKQRAQSFQALAAYNVAPVSLLHEGRAERVRVGAVSADFFAVAGLEPVAGRYFGPEEDRPGQDRVVIVGESFWKTRLGGNLDVLGNTLSLDGESYEVIGIAPALLDLPEDDLQLWKPLAIDFGVDRRGARWLRALARLEEGVSLEQASAEMAALARSLAQEYPDSNKDWGAVVTPWQELLFGDLRDPLKLLWGVTAMMLLICCVNVANLFLGRGAERSREVAVRRALGAGRLRLVRQMLTETTLLSLAGGLLGLGVAYAALSLFSQMDGLPRPERIGVDLRMLLFTLGLALAAGLLFGILPALMATRTGPANVLRGGGRSDSSGGGRLRSLLVVAEVALAVVVLAGAGLFLRSFAKLTDIDPGFEPDRLLTFRVEPPMNVSLQGERAEIIARLQRDRRRAGGFYQRLLDRLEAMPGVESASGVNRGPLAGNWWNTTFSVEGRHYSDPSDRPNALERVVTPGYFQTMGIPLLEGRPLNEADRDGAVAAVVIDEEAARRYWPEESPLGQRLTIFDPEDEDAVWSTVVGVVGSVSYASLQGQRRPVLYTTFSQAMSGHFGNWGMTMALRTASGQGPTVDSLRSAVAEIDPRLPVFAVRSGRDVLASSLRQQRFQLVLLTCFALCALLLAAVGIYGVTARSVQQRSHEIGIRMALGAAPGQVRRLILGLGLRPALLGLLLGLPAVFALKHFIASQLYGISGSDAVALIAAALTMVAAALVACLRPARRASRLDPLRVLKAD
ncbi:MAG TPA: ADOP family duplicated permease [Acidobacteriota bacterium]|nr:ADOP family duplicated permease [Acidobacteriota bacterium]